MASLILRSVGRSWHSPVFSKVAKHNPQPIFCRCKSVNKVQYNNTKSTLKKEEKKLQDYVISRYMKYVRNYENMLEKRFPAAMKVYRIFSIGIKDFYKDLKEYISLRIKITSKSSLETCSRKELELYQKMPRDMWRIAPVLILSAIPFGNYLIFPLALLKPRALLCSHFWSIQQRAEFNLLDLKDRLIHNKPVFRQLQANLDKVPDEVLRKKWSQVLAMIGSGVHPTPQDVIECVALFEKEPYDLNHLPFIHMGHLLKMHGFRKGLLRRKKLNQRAFFLQQMDQAMVREGGVKSLNTESLRNACHIRGLNSSHLSNQDMMDWLNQWLQVSKIVNKKSYSLLLHCPILFAYNHPQNWMLIY